MIYVLHMMNHNSVKEGGITMTKYYLMLYPRNGDPYQSFNYYDTEEKAKAYGDKQKLKYDIITYDVLTMEVN